MPVFNCSFEYVLNILRSNKQESTFVYKIYKTNLIQLDAQKKHMRVSYSRRKRLHKSEDDQNCTTVSLPNCTANSIKVVLKKKGKGSRNKRERLVRND